MAGQIASGPEPLQAGFTLFDDLPRLFERFQKGSDSRGSGLGLPIARKLVLAHGGDIGIESTPGEGTRVTVSLPR